MKFWASPQDAMFGLTLRQEALLFPEKKKQKNLSNHGLGRWRHHCPWSKLTDVFGSGTV
jgi:hypothetical protein